MEWLEITRVGLQGPPVTRRFKVKDFGTIKIRMNLDLDESGGMVKKDILVNYVRLKSREETLHGISKAIQSYLGQAVPGTHWTVKITDDGYPEPESIALSVQEQETQIVDTGQGKRPEEMGAAEIVPPPPPPAPIVHPPPQKEE